MICPRLRRLGRAGGGSRRLPGDAAAGPRRGASTRTRPGPAQRHLQEAVDGATRHERPRHRTERPRRGAGRAARRRPRGRDRPAARHARAPGLYARPSWRRPCRDADVVLASHLETHLAGGDGGRDAPGPGHRPLHRRRTRSTFRRHAPGHAGRQQPHARELRGGGRGHHGRDPDAAQARQAQRGQLRRGEWAQAARTAATSSSARRWASSAWAASAPTSRAGWRAGTCG